MSASSQNISSPSSCIYCREKTPNKGHPYCTDCFKLRTATQRPCFTCKSVLIPCKPAFTISGPMKRLYCTDCSKQYYKSKHAEPAAPAETENVKEDEWINIAYESSIEKDRTLLEQMKELDNDTILEKVREMLKEKEIMIRLLRYENICFNYIREDMDQQEIDEVYGLDDATDANVS